MHRNSLPSFPFESNHLNEPPVGLELPNIPPSNIPHTNAKIYPSFIA